MLNLTLREAAKMFLHYLILIYCHVPDGAAEGVLVVAELVRRLHVQWILQEKGYYAVEDQDQN